ncbi:MAG: hypothetical protein NTW21_25765 [Verrucomicrobia bacterium]|nr:hypothetical protein [Verrucomicrobiota bacterium]
MNEIREILLLHHTHTDIGFTHSQPLVWELHNQFIDRALDLCEETSGWPEPSRTRWTCEVTATLLHWLDAAPEGQIRRFRQLVAAGLLDAGAMFCNLTPLYNAEQLVRSLYPVKRLREQLGLRLDTAINHDVNGLPWPLVGLLRDSGVETLVMGINPHFGGFPLRRPLLFNWVGPDGRTIRVFNGEHYASFERWLEPQFGSTQRMAAGLARYLQTLTRQNYPHDFILLSATHTDFVDNNPPNPHTARMVRQWNDEGRQPVIRFVTPEHLTARLRQVPAEMIEHHAGDWPDFWNFGCAAAATETRINRRTKMRLNTAGMLAALTGCRVAGHGTRSNRAWQGVQIYDEHTWGSWASTWNCEVDEVPAQCNFKANQAYDARCWTGWLLREQLEQLAGNPTEGGAAEGILLVNPGPEKRLVMLTVPTRLVTGQWCHHPGRVHNLEVPAAWLTDDEEREIGPYQVAAYSTRFVPAADLRALPVSDSSCHVGVGVIESGFYRLEFDPAGGCISRLYDKRHAREVLDAASPWDFFGFVQETVDPQQHHGKAKYHGRDALFDTDFAKLSLDMQSGWKPDWPALRRKPGRPDGIECMLTCLGPQLVLRWAEAPGAKELKMTVILAADRPAVLLDVSFHKDSDRWAESTYLTFPLRLKPWQAWYDVAGQTVALDNEQLPGTVRDYATVGTWVAAADDGLCVTLACPDAPMVQLGGFHFGQSLTSVPRADHCLLLGWPLNNYWDTNFPASQPGFKWFRYELTSARCFDAAAAMRFGQAAATPVEYHPVLSRAAITDGPLLEMDNAAVLLTSLRRTRDGAGWFVHLGNPTGRAQSVRLKLPLPWQQAFHSNPLEEELTLMAGGKAPVLELSLEPRSHQLVRLA